jgi:hypothetical protein
LTGYINDMRGLSSRRPKQRWTKMETHSLGCQPETKLERLDHRMNTIESARQFLDQQADVAVWYAEYKGRSEAIAYANNVFSQTFGISIEQILAAKRYHLVNPQDTPEHVIEQYKDEDLAALRDGCFFARSPLEQSQSIEVVKLRFDQGMLGLFKILDTGPTDTPDGLKDFDHAILTIVHHVRPDLLPESGG